VSAWRKQALDLLPEHRQLIEKSENPMALWIELHSRFEEAFTRPGNDLIHRFFAYAKWSLETPGQGEYLSDAATAVAVAFYEHIITNCGVRDNLHKYLSQSEFSALERIFQRHFSPGEFQDFKRLFSERRGKFLKAIPKTKS
jgi:hypothetical protein